LTLFKIYQSYFLKETVSVDLKAFKIILDCNKSTYQLKLFLTLPHSNLVLSILSNVSDPWKSLIPAFFNNLQVSDLDSTHCEIRDLKLHSYCLLKLVPVFDLD